jgi:hypothetical protein
MFAKALLQMKIQEDGNLTFEEIMEYLEEETEDDAGDNDELDFNDS